MWIRGYLPALAVGLSLALGSACGAQQTEQKSQAEPVSVSGASGQLPKIDFSAPLEPPKSVISTVIHGDGGPVQNGESVVVNLTMINGRTGDLASSTYAEGQHPMVTTPNSESLFPVVQQALQGANAGDRVLIEATSKDAFGTAGAPQYGVEGGDPMVMVVDVMGVPPSDILPHAVGRPESQGRQWPTVLLSGRIPQGLHFTTKRPRPRQAHSKVLIEGQGPKIRVGNIVALQYLKQRWGAKSPEETTWPNPAQIYIFDSAGGLQGWQKAVLGAAQGSRILVRIPVESGASPAKRGRQMVYLIDVLGVG